MVYNLRKFICQQCNKEFTKHTLKSKFCSLYCMGKFFSQNPTSKLKGKNNPNWKGGLIKESNGYWYIYSPNHSNKNHKNYVKRCELIMEKKLKRFLTKQEIIHHVDHDKENDKIENLMLFSNQSEHQKFHFSLISVSQKREWQKKSVIARKNQFKDYQ